MQKVISINEFEKTVNSIDDIEEPIIIKRENKEDLVVISLAEYKKSLFLTELSSKLAESEEHIKMDKYIVLNLYLRSYEINMDIRKLFRIIKVPNSFYFIIYSHIL